MHKSDHFPFSPTFFDQIKNVKTEKHRSPQMIKVCKKNSTFQKKKWIFGHFRVLAKITKMAKKPFFILKSGNFFGHTLIIWEDQHFSCNTLFDSVKKSRQKREKAKKMALAQK